jgi:hypothetical protein
MTNIICKAMRMAETTWCMVVGTLMVWAEDAVNEHPILSAITTALVIDRFM